MRVSFIVVAIVATASLSAAAQQKAPASSSDPPAATTVTMTAPVNLTCMADLGPLKTLAGSLGVQRAHFQRGLTDDGMYWEVIALSGTDDVVTVGFEPHAGRLMRVERGGAR